MIVLKTPKEIEIMRKAGSISAGALQLAGSMVKPGVTTWEIDRAVYHYIRSRGAVPSFLHYGGFPASACISVNEEVIHGIPSKDRVIKEGDIVSVDVGACYDGFHGDNAATFAAGAVSDEAKALMDATSGSLNVAIEMIRPDIRLGDVSSKIQEYIESRGFAVVKKYVGHGVGRELHESPDVPNYGRAGHGVRLVPGMVIAVEPMVNAKGEDVKSLKDGWTVVTTSGSLSAHFENTIAVTKDGCEILTKVLPEDLPNV